MASNNNTPPVSNNEQESNPPPSAQETGQESIRSPGALPPVPQSPPANNNNAHHHALHSVGLLQMALLPGLPGLPAFPPRPISIARDVRPVPTDGRIVRPGVSFRFFSLTCTIYSIDLLIRVLDMPLLLDSHTRTRAPRP